MSTPNRIRAVTAFRADVDGKRARKGTVAELVHLLRRARREPYEVIDVAESLQDQGRVRFGIEELRSELAASK